MQDLDAVIGAGGLSSGVTSIGREGLLLKPKVDGRKFVTAILSLVTSISVDLKTRSRNRGLTQRRRNAGCKISFSFINAWPSKVACLLCVTNGLLRREPPLGGDDCKDGSFTTTRAVSRIVVGWSRGGGDGGFKDNDNGDDVDAALLAVDDVDQPARSWSNRGRRVYKSSIA
jgi:hypothetical protein